MDPRLRTAITLTVLVVMLALGGMWGWSKMVEPVPDAFGGGDPVPCQARKVSQGTKVFRFQVTVSVFNGGTRSGLASRTLDLFTDHGFPAGEAGNAPKGVTVHRAQIWTSQPRNPAVRLVASHLGKVLVRPGRRLGPGVVVVVGNRFDDLVRGKRYVVATQDATFCAARTG